MWYHTGIPSQTFLNSKERRRYSLFNVVIIDELAGSGVNGSEKEEDDVEDDEGLKLGDGHSSLDVKLRQGTLAGDDFANDGERNAELRQTPHEQLVGLGKPEHGTLLVQSDGAFQTLAGLDGDGVEASNGRVVHKPPPITEGTDRAQEGEENEEQEQGLCLCQWNAGLNVELRQSSLPRQSLPQNRRLTKASKENVRCQRSHSLMQSY